MGAWRAIPLVLGTAAMLFAGPGVANVAESPVPLHRPGAPVAAAPPAAAPAPAEAPDATPPDATLPDSILRAVGDPLPATSGPAPTAVPPPALPPGAEVLPPAVAEPEPEPPTASAPETARRPPVAPGRPPARSAPEAAPEAPAESPTASAPERASRPRPAPGRPTPAAEAPPETVPAEVVSSDPPLPPTAFAPLAVPRPLAPRPGLRPAAPLPPTVHAVAVSTAPPARTKAVRDRARALLRDPVPAPPSARKPDTDEIDAIVELETTPEEGPPDSFKRPTAPSSATVREAATVKDAIDLASVSLIGIFGTAKSRRAVLRLPSGEIQRISRGDRVEGWSVAGIDASTVRLAKAGETKVLRLP